MNGITAEELMDCWEASGSGYDAEIPSRLWASVPPEMRLARPSAEVVPGRYRGGFAGDGTSCPLVDLSALPGPMRQEMTWCTFRIIELGGRVQMPGTVMLARRLTEITADHRPRNVALADGAARAHLAGSRSRWRCTGGGESSRPPHRSRRCGEVLLRSLWLLDLA